MVHMEYRINTLEIYYPMVHWYNIYHLVYFLVHWWLSSSSRQKIRQGGFEGLIHAAWPRRRLGLLGKTCLFFFNGHMMSHVQFKSV
jgi:hypothetical protein